MYTSYMYTPFWLILYIYMLALWPLLSWKFTQASRPFVKRDIEHVRNNMSSHFSSTPLLNSPPPFPPPPPTSPPPLPTPLSITLSSPHYPAPRLSATSSPRRSQMSGVAVIATRRRGAGGWWWKHAPVARRQPRSLWCMQTRGDCGDCSNHITSLPRKVGPGQAGGSFSHLWKAGWANGNLICRFFFFWYLSFAGIKWDADRELSVLRSCFHGAAAAGLLCFTWCCFLLFITSTYQGKQTSLLNLMSHYIKQAYVSSTWFNILFLRTLNT